MQKAVGNSTLLGFQPDDRCLADCCVHDILCWDRRGIKGWARSCPRPGNSVRLSFAYSDRAAISKSKKDDNRKLTRMTIPVKINVDIQRSAPEDKRPRQSKRAKLIIARRKMRVSLAYYLNERRFDATRTALLKKLCPSSLFFLVDNYLKSTIRCLGKRQHKNHHVRVLSHLLLGSARQWRQGRIASDRDLSFD